MYPRKTGALRSTISAASTALSDMRIRKVALLRRLCIPLGVLASFGCTGGDLLVPGDEQPTDGQQTALSATVSTMTAAPASIDAVTGTASIIVTARDENGDPVEGATV